MASTSDRYRLIVAGDIAQAAADIIEARFGDGAAIHGLGNTAVDLSADQPSLRALVTLLWDLGHDLLAILRLRFLGRWAPDASLAGPTPLSDVATPAVDVVRPSTDHPSFSASANLWLTSFEMIL